MADDKVSRIKFVVRHSNLLEPEDYCRFIHFDGFTTDWKDLRLRDDDLATLQIQIMLAPQQGSVIPGSGGVRKLRFSPPSWNKGKRGAIRVLYAIFPDFSVVVLAAAYAKAEQEDISSDAKKSLKVIIREVQGALDRGD